MLSGDGEPSGLVIPAGTSRVLSSDDDPCDSEEGCGMIPGVGAADALV